MTTKHLSGASLAAVCLFFSVSAYAVTGNVNLGDGMANQSFTVSLPDGSKKEAESDHRGVLVFDFPSDGSYQIEQNGTAVHTVVVSGGRFVSGAVVPITGWSGGNLFTGHRLSAGLGSFDSNEKKSGREFSVEYANYDVFPTLRGNAHGSFLFGRLGFADPDPLSGSFAVDVDATSLDVGLGWEWLLLNNLLNNQEIAHKWRATWGLRAYLNYTDMDADFVVPVGPPPSNGGQGGQGGQSNQNDQSGSDQQMDYNQITNDNSGGSNGGGAPPAPATVRVNVNEESLGIGGGVFMALHNLNSPFVFLFGADTTILFDDVIGNDHTFRVYASAGFRF